MVGVFLEKKLLSWSRNSVPLKEPERSFCSLKPADEPYPESIKSNLYLHTHFLNIHALNPPKWYFPFTFSD